MTNFKKALAFTLAETLIVMAIIGVVSALTLPNLNSSTGEKEKVAKVKKIYQNLTDAFGRAEVVYGPVEEWFQTDTTIAAKTTRFKDRMTEFMKVSKDCGSNTGCWSTASFKYLDGSEEEKNYYQQLKSYGEQFVILADGTALSFSASGGSTIELRIRVDIDGPTKGKTQEGVDIFDFNYLTAARNEGVTPSMHLYNLDDNFGCCGYYATAWVVLNGNMDYLKATITDGNAKCPNGKTLNWETQTTCK